MDAVYMPGSGSTATKLAVTALSCALAWRLWRFTVQPRLLHPDEPKELPYWIPYVGHAASFFMGFNGAIEKGRNYFAPSRAPFAMTVAGQTIYIATSADDINTVWKTSKAISLNPITMDMYVWGGLSPRSRAAMFEPHPRAQYNERNARPLTPTQMTIELHHQQLHSGPGLDAFVEDKVVPGLFAGLALDDERCAAVRAREGKDVVVSLLDLTVELFIAQSTTSYFGPALLELAPDLVSSFMAWEYVNWKFLFQLPDVFARDMLAAKKAITDAFTGYYRLPRSERPGAVGFVTDLEDMLREVGLSEDEMGNFTLLHYWAVVGNVYKLAFWLTAHLVHNPTLLSQIRDEVLPAVQGHSVDERYLTEQCPKLDSLVGETLRLTVTSSLARVVMETCVVGGKTLRAGNKIMLPIKELHYDPSIWASTPSTLTPARFLAAPKLAKSASYRPWGGGHTLCPGRFLARRSVNAFIAILLSRYDVALDLDQAPALASATAPFPKSDGARPSPGVVPVGQGEDVRIRLSPRAQA
ncbi:cytochrome P450 [Massariosphaeria phaeospora]|uniref:Cytochrome P450 n=1 Tax=Massariosphaeria phaeospora TaxID=100035 RepID=A0A7C8I4D4_9PLEO|nr:cytochrome P450 [Massariosphaeria phaeospora]